MGGGRCTVHSNGHVTATNAEVGWGWHGKAHGAPGPRNRDQCRQTRSSDAGEAGLGWGWGVGHTGSPHTCRAMTSFKLCCSFNKSLHSCAISLMEGSRLRRHAPHKAHPRGPHNPRAHAHTTNTRCEAARGHTPCRTRPRGTTVGSAAQTPACVCRTCCRTRPLGQWASGPPARVRSRTWTGPRPPGGTATRALPQVCGGGGAGTGKARTRADTALPRATQQKPEQLST